MDLVGDKTVLLNRWEERTAVTAVKNQQSFGHTFELAMTEAGVNGVPSGLGGVLEGHHRIVKYVSAFGRNSKPLLPRSCCLMNLPLCWLRTLAG